MDAVIFARYWEAGRVKTRLCPPLAPAEAAALSRCCLDVLAARLRLLPDLSVVIAYEPEGERQAFAQRYPDVSLEAQRGADLTARLQHVASNRTMPCVISGSDCPTVPLEFYRQAMAALREGADVVLGPTEDGGSYILGLGPACAAWFEGVPWSTERVADALRDRARSRGWRMAELPLWYDVDRPPDLARLSADVRACVQRGELGPGLGGKADLLGKGEITVDTPDAYICERVKDLTGGRQTLTMTEPQTIPDFPVAVAESAAPAPAVPRKPAAGPLVSPGE